LTVANPGISVPNPPITAIQTHVIGNRTLDAERIETEEIAHNGTFGNIKTSITGFHYKLSHIIQANVASTTFAPPNLDVISSYWNGGAVSAWGGEMGVAVALSQTFSTFANYSYQYLHQDSIDQTIALESPRHKANAGLQYRSHGFNANTQLHWVDRTLWPTEVNGALPIFSPVNSYFLLDAHAGYAFSGRWDGFEIGVTAFNLLNHDHYELLPVQPSGAPGQNGEIIRQRVTATASYKF
jgi:outer membrane receptor protein involved in Fe transport